MKIVKLWPKETKINNQTLSRVRKLVKLPRNRRSKELVKALSKVAKHVTILLELPDKGHKKYQHRDHTQSTTGALRFKVPISSKFLFSHLILYFMQ